MVNQSHQWPHRHLLHSEWAPLGSTPPWPGWAESNSTPSPWKTWRSLAKAIAKKRTISEKTPTAKKDFAPLSKQLLPSKDRRHVVPWRQRCCLLPFGPPQHISKLKGPPLRSCTIIHKFHRADKYFLQNNWNPKWGWRWLKQAWHHLASSCTQETGWLPSAPLLDLCNPSRSWLELPMWLKGCDASSGDPQVHGIPRCTAK